MATAPRSPTGGKIVQDRAPLTKENFVMTADDPRHHELVEWLKSQGHSDQQIQRILAKVEDYDSQTMHESIFDSIDSGDFDIASLIDEALADDEQA